MLNSAYEIIVRQNSVESLLNDVSVELLKEIYTEQFNKDCKITDKLKLCRTVKQKFVKEYKDSDLSILIGNLFDFDKVHCLTFQREEVLQELISHGTYTPSVRFASEPDTAGAVMEQLGYYPVWLINPLILGQYYVDKDAFTLLPFMGYLQTAFPMHRYGISKDFVLLEFEFDRSVITSGNSTSICTCLPRLSYDDLVGVYKFYLNDRECGYKNTYQYPYIKVLATTSNSAMCLSDYESATAYSAYTGTEADFV